MPKLRKETIDKIKEMAKEEYTNVEIAEELDIHEQTVAKHVPNSEENEEEEEDSPEGGPMKITGLEDSYSSRLKKKFQTIKRWIEGSPVGVDPTKKGPSYLLKRVKETPEVMDDYRRLIKWIKESTSAKEMSMEEVMSNLMEIDQDGKGAGFEPAFGPEKGNENSMTPEDVEKAVKKARGEDSTLKKARDKIILRTAEKASDTFGLINRYLNIVEKHAMKNEDFRKKLVEDLPPGLLFDLLKAKGEPEEPEEPEPEGKGGADSLIGKSDLDEPVEEMSDEKLKKFSEKSEQLSPDLKARVALVRTKRKRAKKESEEETRSPIEAREAKKGAEKEMDRGKTEKKGEEELHDHIPEDL